jgi:hypothetical protein
MTTATLTNPSIDTGPLPAPNAWAETLNRIASVIVREATGCSFGETNLSIRMTGDIFKMDDGRQFVSSYLHSGHITMHYMSDTRATTSQANN